MTAAFYRDYVVDLKDRIDRLHEDAERYQTFALTMELLAQRNLVTYTEKKVKGQTEGLCYRRDFTTGRAVQMQPQNAYGLFSGFFGLGQFLAFSGQVQQHDAGQLAEFLTGGWQYPTCAVHLVYRQKGAPRTESTKMHFVGLNSDEDAVAYQQETERAQVIAQRRPLSSDRFFEWK